MVEMARSLPLFVAIGTVAERSESLHDCEVGLEFDQEWADQENPRVCAILGQGGTSIPDIVETVAVVKNGGRWKNKVGPFRVTRSIRQDWLYV